MKTFYWLVKREFWEHRGGFLWTPVIVGGVFLLLNLMGIITSRVIGKGHGFNLTFGHNNMVLGFVVFFYCLGALYDDRRDRSLLFWKSLPISDTAAVLSKVVSATVLAPLIAIIVGTLTGIAMLLMFAIALSFHGVSVWHLLTLSHPFRVIGNLVGSIPLYVLWALPAVGWLMLCSAWARSKPFLWAVVIPIGVGIVIGWFNLLGTIEVANGWYWRDIVGRILGSVFPGGWFSQVTGIGGSNPTEVLSTLGLSHAYTILATANLWIGVSAAAVMLAGAIWLRRWRDDS